MKAILLMVLLIVCGRMYCYSATPGSDSIVRVYYKGNPKRIYSLTSYKSGLKDSTALVYYPNGKIERTMTYSKGNITDSCVWYKNERPRYKSIRNTYSMLQFGSGLKDSVVMRFYKSGNLLSRFEYQKGKLVDSVKGYKSGGVKGEFHLDSGKLSGRFETRYDDKCNSIKTRGTYFRGKLADTFYRYYSAKCKRNSYQKILYRYSNGYYKDGLIEGRYYYWTKDGYLFREDCYEKGKFVEGYDINKKGKIIGVYGPGIPPKSK